ncbi:MAG: hypothetical protein WBQ26_14975 [Gemmatimonadaceae bacterium]
MKLDIRLPIGLLFSVIGVMLSVYGIVAPTTIYDRSLGIDVNLWWGLVMLAFGLVMLGFALRARRSAPPPS